MKADKTLTGKVISQLVSAGSKSEHKAVCLQTDNGTYILRREGGNPFNDADLQKLVGKQISSTGILTDNLFIAKAITEIK